MAGNSLQAAERGAKLTSQLLAFSRVQKLELKPTIVGPLIERIQDLLKHTLGPTIRLDLAIDEAEVPVLADHTQLELAVLNLAINARDAMPSGGTLSISTHPREVSGDAELMDGEYLEIRVADTGTGMPADVAARAFDPFFTTKPVGQGTGLGLSMVYGVARQSGGAARIESAEGRGTTISLLLKRTSAPREETGAPEVVGSGAGPVEARILVIDDENDVRKVVAETLEDFGHNVSTAADGPEGLSILEKEQFDLIVLDFAMPGMNGAEVAEAARRMRPDQRILFVTGFSDTEALTAAAGDAPVLRKPFRASDLAEALRFVLGERPRS
jgi:CheY-like chemotaxis protein